MTEPVRRLNLYTTLGCHLCEDALALLHRARSEGFEFQIVEVEISESDSLMERYGIRIPVIRFDNEERELGWPFQFDELVTFVTHPESSS